MFRAIVLSIALTLAVGPNAELLCNVLCHSETAAANECDHEESTNSPGVAGDNSCDRVVLSVGAFLREDVRRGVSAPDADYAIFVPRYQLAPSTTDTRPRHELGREWWLEQRPLATALRI